MMMMETVVQVMMRRNILKKVKTKDKNSDDGDDGDWGFYASALE